MILRKLSNAGTTWPSTALSIFGSGSIFTYNRHRNYFMKLNTGPERSSPLLKSHSWEVARLGVDVMTADSKSSTRLTDTTPAGSREHHKREATKKKKKMWTVGCSLATKNKCLKMLNSHHLLT